MKKQKVSLGERSYNIYIAQDILPAIGRFLKNLPGVTSVFVISNKNIKALYGRKLQHCIERAGLDAAFLNVADSEKSKSHKTWFNTLRRLAAYDRGRGVVVAALGGGVIGDLSGFIASTYRRGVPFIQIPTTLLAQVDSAIGGKVGIDIESAKNIAGAFYQPKAVFSGISFLKTLPLREIKNGLAEIIKYGIILDSQLFAYLENNMDKILKRNEACLEHIIWRCSLLKAKVVSLDERESAGLRSILNFGHTIGHAIEAASSYSKSVSHGEAVAVGMLAAFDIAGKLGLVRGDTKKRAWVLIKKAGLPDKIKGINKRNLLNAISYDKKTIKGVNRWVLPIRIGHAAVFCNIPPDAVEAAVDNRIS